VRVARLQSAFDIGVAYRHFPLHPATPEAGLTLEELFAGRNIDLPAAQEQMSRLMAQEGLPYGQRTMTYNSRLAQELAAWAVTQAGGDGIHDALFRAYFVEQVNIAKLDNLLEIAERVGLSASEAKEVLEERRFRPAVDADGRRSRELGVSGVPTFVVGERGVVGAQSYEQLEKFVLSVGAQRREN